MIQVDNLTKHYGPVTAIHDVSFNVAKGQIVGFLGPNGAGKSTTMRILSCFMPATGGTARVAGYDVFSQSMEVRRRIGYLPENVAALHRPARSRAYLDFVAEIKGVAARSAQARVADVMERCFITDMQNRLIGKLSKGYRQRVGPGPGPPGRPGGADPRRAHHRARPAADRGDPRADPVAGRPAHRDPVDAHPARGVDGVRRRRHHQPRAHRRPGHRSELVQQVFPTARIEVRVANAPGDVGGRPAGGRRAWWRCEPLAARDGSAGFVVESARDRDVRGGSVRLVDRQSWALQSCTRWA